MKKKIFPLSKVYQLLEPSPVVMVTTCHNKKPNIMTMSWYTMVDFIPPIVAIVCDEHNYTFNNLKETKECVINIPTVNLASKIIKIGNTTGEKVDKFKKFNLTPELASIVNAPMIRECYANLEGKIIDMKMVAKYNLFIVEIVNALIATSRKRQLTVHHCGNGVFIVDGKIIKLPSRKK